MPESTIDLGVLAGSDVEFRAETIYFLVLDRFAEGNPGKDREDDEMFDASRQDWHKYWGGDLQGLMDRLDYLHSFGISSVWTTPLFDQVEAMALGDVPRAPIHGYWTRDFKRINPRWMNHPNEKRLFTRDDTTFDKLLKNLHARDMKFVLDIVCNHSSPATERGKGKLYDDGKLIADFDNDQAHWYHHYGEVTDWSDDWQVQNCELAGLATFNENNILYRNHIKEAIKLWIGKGIDAIRIDTVKHMPLWFWQEFTSDISVANPNVFRFGEWIYNSPDNATSVEFANKAGMSLLDFGFCQAVRECFTGAGDGFTCVQRIFDLDGHYAGATELVTFFENHDMPRLQSLGVSDRLLELALVLLLTTRGIPCLYYGCEQYLHDDTDGGDDPYNRPMMNAWEPTEATRIIGILAGERRNNQAVQLGNNWPKWVDADSYVFTRCYRDSRCLVMLNKGPARQLDLEGLELPDGDHTCLLSGETLHLQDGRATVELPEQSARVFAIRGNPVEAKAVIRLQINGAPTKPGDRLAVIGDCEELGQWDLRGAYHLDCINSNTWFGEIPFEASAGSAIGYKYVIFPGGEIETPQRENRVVRRRLVTPEGAAKWRDRWEE
ncbi:alpha-amylase family glycosyl hydrolase [Luteolibacter arcticus]|uniref:Alpha-amylase family glycosyl hydrolase n=1 Tax=Luteolibacter arcticus TaxID=1581411 RepID=A0ABT3GNR2_9BACT|nr:alpha-amylase family glycosyl hydrolase [Luteolibacter arcticus]MCW1925153.1 alpha-amylase family glycosyl hydrolase [Luteolibacter arcticus]